MDFFISESFFRKIKEFDKDGKIKIYEDRFFVQGIPPMELETRERNMLSAMMGDHCWKMQIDADEYCLNFEILKKFLNKNSFILKDSAPAVNFLSTWITLFKQNERGFLSLNPTVSLSA